MKINLTVVGYLVRAEEGLTAGREAGTHGTSIEHPRPGVGRSPALEALDGELLVGREEQALEGQITCISPGDGGCGNAGESQVTSALGEPLPRGTRTQLGSEKAWTSAAEKE